MLQKCCTQYASKFGKLTEDWKRSIFIPIPKKGNAKECSNYSIIALISQATKIVLKMLQARLQQIHEPWTSRCSSWLYKRQRNQRANCQHLLDYRKSKRVPEKHLFLLYWLYAKAFDCMDYTYSLQFTTNCGKFWKRWEYQTTWSASWEMCMQVRKQQLEPDMEQQSGSK